eukprot:GILK01002143.1.p1 GENE.GILK01002143.1~~GILK01002143.1.p1  ORF type:complete len:251 (-),score=71.65 GILK01002143.1:309-1022(-)
MEKKVKRLPVNPFAAKVQVHLQNKKRRRQEDDADNDESLNGAADLDSPVINSSRARLDDEEGQPKASKRATIEDKYKTEINDFEATESGALAVGGQELKKAKKKKNKAKKAIPNVFERSEADAEKSKAVVTAALNYLSLWNIQDSSWKFQKSKQVWLLKHMYDDQLVPAKHFSILVKYLEHLKGNSRDQTLREAKQIVETEDPNKKLEVKLGMDMEAEKKRIQTRYLRAVEMAKLLS